ncbi:UDP-N-acetylglucosamine--N-acetylmuramyl-(pentapeptide) pyrophosphoryl-undecaprenol N-acetylglucosamine transferase [Oceanotoga sp. DSM 15011]|jgi:UDP-N-acetylglucosamine--N-acetylmuramyl-(pentapeptide) pyrophosphoryl-undecaprenol N-acetylglucosamine transferase|uniref:UDP-N-acetylglucosamine--N-acetylmuramyl-(pentapeptide) pyrophosphoryl-undecaprenol N-acetylglucosamine transferase n=1 Tax=Oceanotoga teriensis TaxID=515440 RepID=A0AA45C7P9_9BACT|nr:MULTISPECIES: UDP-N-acetylglucosamine--N-acetylmuramyl-(pentapeptide) pyrophosphoryl-undecaprenol N-acetylglucosamine transferase [Oceanotoga]MDN5342119.1 UDP-N-acetylglucosamine--N-acetylmuramyl-(pentapeptide) pyrophosphoryl-undecaprenol [Oceanotoga sp.]MDO7976253.1 UDP-N-acetylglucosamine--N-acetylmuramyl-(pentapeptide) pyrophosphoryl-undecaprenol N-acetylglucosamine transferase [Oceanotoga teriensis]PWJ95450.1 UDP-N-acetylglucosamine-N-acetylmuramylpentapeptide N-acetylglucosamine transfer
MKKIKVVVAGGGTGGHYYPALAVLKELKKKNDLEILYFVTDGRIEEKKLPKDIPDANIIKINMKGLIRPIYNPKNIQRLFHAYKKYIEIKDEIKKFSPDFGFLTGGYICGPVGYSLKKLNIPFYVHEQNSIMGITNKRLSKWAKKIFTSFYFKEFIQTGNPVRISDHDIKRENLKKYGIENISNKILLVFGGSLGSNKVDDIMYEVYKKSSINTKFIHITENDNKFKNFKNVFCFKYIDELYEIISVCDGIVSRAGATSIAEIKFYDQKAILIPWSGASENHQYYNALELQKNGKAIIIDEKKPNIEDILNFINKINIKNINYTWHTKKDVSTNEIINNIDEI